ncbi:MAG: 30S ribosomal protein S6 [Nannocystaceae bacterium]
MPDAGVVHSIRSQRGTQREYETVLVLRSQTNKASISELIDRLKALFEKNGARLQSLDNWGLRTLAYPIRRSRQGIYLYLKFLGGSDIVREMERNLRIYDDVLRYLTVLVDDDVDPAARPSELTDELVEAASESSPDPVEVERARVEAERKAELERRAEEEAAAKAEAEAKAAAAADPESAEAAGAVASPAERKKEN